MRGIRERALFYPVKSGGVCHWQVRGQEYKKSECPFSCILSINSSLYLWEKNQRTILYIGIFQTLMTEPTVRNTLYSKASTQIPTQTHSNIPKNEMKFPGTVLIFVFDDKV